MLAHVFTYRADDIQRATQINPGPSTHQNLAEHVPTRRFIPLTAWPLELVLEVAQYLDESSLLDVGATCKQLNALAASLYYNEQHTSSSSFHLQGNDSKGQLLYAARLFFQAPRITRISFVVKPGIQRFRADMEELVRLINCTNVLERVELNFGGIDAALSKTGLETWLQDEENKRAYPVDFGAASLVKLIADVVDAVESAGCHDLSLVGGDFLCQSIHSIQTSIGTRRRKQVGNDSRPAGFLRVLSQGLWNSSGVTNSIRQHALACSVRSKYSTDSPSCFTSLSMNLNLFCNPFLLLWSLQTLSRASSTLTTLHVGYEKSTSGIHSTLQRWYSSPEGNARETLKFPVLEEFSFGPGQRVAFHDPTATLGSPELSSFVVTFLALHPTIARLDLTDVKPPRLAPQQPFLPNLRSLKSDLKLAGWILTNRAGPPTSLFEIVLRIFPPNLDVFQSTTLSSFHFLSLMTSSQLTFEFMHSSLCLQDWFRDHLSPEFHSRTQLVGICHITLRFLGHFARTWSRWCICDPECRELFHQWLNAFPDLEEVKIEMRVMGSNHEDEETRCAVDEEFLAELFGRFCPQIKRVVIDGKVLELGAGSR